MLKVFCAVLASLVLLVPMAPVTAKSYHSEPIYASYKYYDYFYKPKRRNKTLSFALIADAPYGDENVDAFDNLIADVNADRSVKFVMHGGDIKSGGAECTDERIRTRFDQYQKFRTPFIFTPGDNEWTDCHRVSNGQYDPLERLQFLRDVFYPNPGYTTGGRLMRLRTQSKDAGFETFVENILFKKSRVVFSTIHVVGSNNNLRPWSGIDATDSFDTPRADRLAEFELREKASIAWLRKTFSVAKANRSKGVFILMHGNPRFSTNETEDDRAGFNAFLDELFKLTEEFNKPVLLAHGDSHVYFVDKPKLVPYYADGNAATADDVQQFLPNLTRVQTFGDTPQHWIKVTVDPRKESVFVVEPQAVKGNL